MIFSLFKRNNSTELVSSRLCNEKDFYTYFLKDLTNCKEEVIIESPYITSSRMAHLIPIFQALLKKRIKIRIITRDPVEHDEMIRYQATNEILYCKEIGITITLVKGSHHRKVAIIDKRIIWEGSLNILSHTRSKEIMRRIKGEQLAKEMSRFLGH